ncbi:MAG: sugar ABC transporter ATP-binding protein [Clostridiales bacterium]|nr:sugar ABC transporter ATP-binding protein [Bacillota bacterium]NLL55338.1 sugar ABC transporter ATP-binding protein [Clostridiales bacterium]
MAEFLEMRGITKRFPGVLALDNVSLSVRKGEVHALLGENGAGKSTLMKILSGAYRMDEGEILFDGKPVEIHSSHDAQALNISTIYQELNLTEQLTVAENIFMGRQPTKGPFMVDWKGMFSKAQTILDDLGVDISAQALVRDLGVAHKQMVELAKSLSINSRVLIMDEPTAPLTSREIKTLFDTIRMLRSRGVSIIYISHRLEEVMEVCDRATIMRDGRNVTVLNVAETNLDEIIRYMVGRELKEKFPKIHPDIGETRLQVDKLNAGKQVKNISFSVRSGEILGIAGLVGAGRTETARAIFGMDPKESGTVSVDGKEVSIQHPLDAIRAGIGFVTEDRKGEGLVLTMPVSQNITLATLEKFGAALRLDLGGEKAVVLDFIDKLDIKTPSHLQLARNLSGGNQQKVVLAKWLLSDAKVILFDEPTRGIDVGAKIEVYNIINSLIRSGVAVVMISSELPEILGMSDRVAVMHQGEITGIFDNDGTLTQEKVLYYATGGKKHTA